MQTRADEPSNNLTKRRGRYLDDRKSGFDVVCQLLTFKDHSLAVMSDGHGTGISAGTAFTHRLRKNRAFRLMIIIDPYPTPDSYTASPLYSHAGRVRLPAIVDFSSTRERRSR
ncbi:hypothetical protein LshimejAT787_1400740 [Lyophyllum shimeji]|uniref:Uncharacterized protein n=1 Tax=Lyophyllum shimeji TaxID=47721 RepID=A0A9P3PYH2_LYOSH|nr:hypothetical protein LshimejAT787_1400740 [Lyophyllum shimeji]